MSSVITDAGQWWVSYPVSYHMPSLASFSSASFDVLCYIMTDQNALYEDMSKLNTLYEELCWGHDDELVFTHDGTEIIIYNKTKEQNNERKSWNPKRPCRNDRIHRCCWCISHDRTNHPRHSLMLALAATLLGAFIIGSLLTEDIGDDDDWGGGTMIPATAPTNN